MPADPAARAATPRAGTALLCARAMLFAAVSTGLAAVAHTVPGGAAPSRWVLLAAAVAMLEVGLLAGRTQRRFPFLLAGLAATQVVLHLFLDATAPLGHAADHLRPATSTVGMTLAHAAATLAVAGWLRHGEAALWRLLRAVGLFALLGLPASPRSPVSLHRPAALVPLRIPHPRAGRPGEVRRRGPPVRPVAVPAR